MDVIDEVRDWKVDELTAHRRQLVKDDVLARMDRDRRVRRTRSAAAVATAGLCLAGTATGLLAGSGEPADAVWRAVPQAVSIGPDDPMVEQCRADLADSGSVTPATLAAMRITVAERRGTSRAVLLSAGGQQAICIDTPGSRLGGSTQSAPLGAGTTIVLAGNGGSTDPGSDVRYVYGRVDARVASVNVSTADGTEVEASVADGAWLAWWPASSGGPARVRAEDPRHVVLGRVDPR